MLIPKVGDYIALVECIKKPVNLVWSKLLIGFDNLKTLFLTEFNASQFVFN